MVGERSRVAGGVPTPGRESRDFTNPQRKRTMPQLNETQAVDTVMSNLARLPREEITLLQDQHNADLHDSDDFDIADDDELEGLTIMDEREFFETYML